MSECRTDYFSSKCERQCRIVAEVSPRFYILLAFVRGAYVPVSRGIHCISLSNGSLPGLSVAHGLGRVPVCG